jgi:hypothetical protein
MAKIKNGFDRLTEAQLLVEATSIVTKCTGNPYFTALQPAVQAVDAACNAYSTSLNAARGGDRNAIAVKDARKKDLIALLRKLGDFIGATAGGDQVILVSSGYPLVKEREPLPPLGKPNPPFVSTGLNAGHILLEGKSGRSVKAVIHMVTPDPVTDSSTWSSTVTTSRKHTFSNLESGKRYWFKQCMIGTNQQYVESDAVSYVSQ